MKNVKKHEFKKFILKTLKIVFSILTFLFNISMGFICGIINTNTKENKKSKNKDLYNLEDWQQKLVEKNEYEPNNFEEEELEEDDYYNEDD